MMLLDRTIGRKLRILRRQQGLSSAELAALIGLRGDDIQAFETGRERIGPERLAQISEVLGCPLSTFFVTIEGHKTETGADRVPHGLEDQIKAQALELARAYYVVGDFRSRAATG